MMVFKRVAIAGNMTQANNMVNMYLEASMEKDCISSYEDNIIFFHETNALINSLEAGVILFGEASDESTKSSWYAKAKVFIGRVIDAIIKFFKDLFGKGKIETPVSSDDFNDLARETLAKNPEVLAELLRQLRERDGDVK